MAAQTSPADDRLRHRAALLALALAAGEITLDQLRAVMRQELAEDITIAFLSGTGGQRNADIDDKLRELIQQNYAELDRLIRLLERPDNSRTPADTQRRLELFADTLDSIQAEGERLVEQPSSPLIPAAIGAALLALLGRVRTPGRGILPDTGADAGTNAGALVEHFGSVMDDLSAQVHSGQLTVDQWLEQMRIADRNLHAALYRSGLGRELDGADLARLNERIRQQWEFLDGFAADIRAGKLTPEQIKARARMYLDNGQASLQEGAVARLGIPLLPAYPKDGQSECLGHCRCWWDIRQVEGGFDCFWTLRPAEHCSTCENSAALWSPIQVRNGVLGPYSTIGTFA